MSSPLEPQMCPSVLAWVPGSPLVEPPSLVQPPSLVELEVQGIPGGGSDNARDTKIFFFII